MLVVGTGRVSWSREGISAGKHLQMLDQSQTGILGNRNPSSKQNREMAGCCMPGMFINTGQNADI